MKNSLILLSLLLSGSAFAAKATLDLVIQESKIVFSSQVESFSVQLENGEQSKDLKCRNQGFYLSSIKSLYAGWDVTKAMDYRDNSADAEFREYNFASCRSPSDEVLAWFPKERSIEFSVSDQLLDDDYDPTELPVLLQAKSLGDGTKKFFKCNEDFTRELLRENEDAKVYKLQLKCASVPSIDAKTRGPVDFISEPGPFAAVGSYRGWMLPALESSADNFAKVTAALLAKVPQGKYSGAMSTLSRKCEVKVEWVDQALQITHTITSGTRPRSRVVKVKAEDLLGFAEGDVYADPIRVEEVAIGKFSAAEFKDPKKGSLTLRFEKNTNAEAQILRINGSDAYCRRLVKVTE